MGRRLVDLMMRGGGMERRAATVRPARYDSPHAPRRQRPPAIRTPPERTRGSRGMPRDPRIP